MLSHSQSGERGRCPHHQAATRLSLVGQTFPACSVRKCWQPGSSCSAVQKQRQAWEAKCRQTFAIPWSWKAQGLTEAVNSHAGDIFLPCFTAKPSTASGKGCTVMFPHLPTTHKQPCLLLEEYLGTAQPTAWLLQAFQAFPSKFCLDFPTHCSSAEHKIAHRIC